VTKKIVLAMTILGLAAFAAPPAVADGDEDKVMFYTNLRMRYENANNYLDFADHDDTQAFNDRGDMWAYRALVGMKAKLANDVWFKADFQSVGSFGNRGPALSTANPLTQNVDLSSPQSDTELYRAIVGLDDIGGSPVSVHLGRQEYQIGNGLILGNEHFYSGTVYDGVIGNLGWEKFDLDGYYLITNERNDFANFGGGLGGDEDAKLGGFTGKLHFQAPMKNHLDIYAIRNWDGLATTMKPDNLTLGAVWYRWVKSIEDAEDGAWEWSVEIAAQSGELTTLAGSDLDTSGFASEGHVGYNFVSNQMMHSVYGGYIMQSGDDDLTDTDVDGWMPLVPRTHGRFGKTDFFGADFGCAANGACGQGGNSGIMGYHVGYGISGGDGRHRGYLTLWSFAPFEDSIEVGAASPNDIDDFGAEIDLGYSFGYSDNLWLFIAYSELLPDDGITGGSGFPDDSVTRIYGGAYLKFPAKKAHK
jgi:hypothetical protein